MGGGLGDDKDFGGMGLMEGMGWIGDACRG